MANLNLSQFGENTSVSNADYTFVWDSAASISKKVSRNSWLNSGTLTSDAPVTISQTWGNNLATFKALVVNAAGTSDANSASGSLLADFQVGGVSKASVSKGGQLTVTAGLATAEGGIAYGSEFFLRSVITNDSVGVVRSNTVRASMGTSGFRTTAAGILGFSDNITNNANIDTILLRDGAANTLALRNGAGVPQAFRVYNTFLGTTANEWFEIDWKTTAGLLKIGTTSGGTGVGRPIELNASGNYINFNIGTVVKFAVVSNRNLSYQSIEFNSDNTHDIGASGANRPRDIYAGGNGIFGGLISAQNGFRAPGSSQLIASANGIWRLTNSDANDFNRLQLGGTTDAFPAIARDGAGIKFTGAAAGSTSWIKVPPVAVGSLPLAATAGAGARAFVNDALSPTFGSAVTGGGAVLVPVYSTGSAWNVG